MACQRDRSSCPDCYSWGCNNSCSQNYYYASGWTQSWQDKPRWGKDPWSKQTWHHCGQNSWYEHDGQCQGQDSWSKQNWGQWCKDSWYQQDWQCQGQDYWSEQNWQRQGQDSWSEQNGQLQGQDMHTLPQTIAGPVWKGFVEKNENGCRSIEPFAFPTPDASAAKFPFCTSLESLSPFEAVNFLARDFFARNGRAYFHSNGKAQCFPGDALKPLSKLDCKRGKDHDDLSNNSAGWLKWFYSCPHIMYFAKEGYGRTLNDETKSDFMETIAGFSYAAATANRFLDSECQVWFEPPQAGYVFQAMWFVFQSSGLRPLAFDIPASHEVKTKIETGMAQFYTIPIATSMQCCEITPFLTPSEKLSTFQELLQLMVDGEIALLPKHNQEAMEAGVDALKAKLIHREWAPGFRQMIQSVNHSLLDKLNSPMLRITRGTASGPKADGLTGKTGPWQSWTEVTYIVSGDCAQ